MADLRIYELADTQASYSSGIFLAVDDSVFSNTKKIALGTIYPKTNTLSAVGNFNPASTLLRTDNGSGVENKVTVNNLLSDADVVTTLKSLLSLNVTTLSFTGTPDSNFSSVTNSGKKYGNVSMINFQFTAAAASGLKYLKTITGYVSPGFTVFFVAGHDNQVIDEGAWGSIDSNGNIYVAVGNSGIWRFQATIIS